MLPLLQAETAQGEGRQGQVCEMRLLGLKRLPARDAPSTQCAVVVVHRQACRQTIPGESEKGNGEAKTREGDGHRWRSPEDVHCFSVSLSQRGRLIATRSGAIAGGSSFGCMSGRSGLDRELSGVHRMQISAALPDSARAIGRIGLQYENHLPTCHWLRGLVV